MSGGWEVIKLMDIEHTANLIILDFAKDFHFNYHRFLVTK